MKDNLLCQAANHEIAQFPVPDTSPDAVALPKILKFLTTFKNPLTPPMAARKI